MLLTPNVYIRKCIHFIGVDQHDKTEISERVICESFPGGIPDEIAYGDNLHLQPLLNQGNDIVFEKM